MTLEEEQGMGQDLKSARSLPGPAAAKAMKRLSERDPPSWNSNERRSSNWAAPGPFAPSTSPSGPQTGPWP